MKDTTIAVDLAKNVFEIAISGEAGKVSKQLRAYSSHRERRIQSKLNSESGEAERSSKR